MIFSVDAVRPSDEIQHPFIFLNILLYKIKINTIVSIPNKRSII